MDKPGVCFKRGLGIEREEEIPGRRNIMCQKPAECKLLGMAQVKNLCGYSSVESLWRFSVEL